jgi:hypothetical protein
MKHIGTRIHRLEKNITKDRFLVVFGKNTEDKEESIKHESNLQGIDHINQNLYIIYLNIHSITR